MNEEFEINEFLLKTLEPLGIPVYFTARKKANLPVIVYNITGENGYEFWEDQETITRYKVCINIFSKGNYIEIKNNIKKLMLNAGFKKTDIPECQYDEDIELYNQPMFFVFYKENLN